MGGPKGAHESELAHQIRNYSNFTWLNGTFVLDWLIHNLDVACWVKDAWPVSAQGQGGRQVRREADQMFDHFAVEYTFADGTRLFAQGRHMPNTWCFYTDLVHGAKGSAVLGEGVGDPRIYKGHRQTSDNLIWRHKVGPRFTRQRGIPTRSNTTCCSTLSARTSLTTRPSAAQRPPWSAFSAGWLPSRARK